MAKPREKWRVLLVEDEPDLLKLVSRVLEQGGFEVMPATNGKTGLALATSARKPHLIITDIMMPDMDGLEMVKLIKREPRTGKVPPVIFLTAKSTPKDVIAGISAGARHYLTKPFTISELLEKVRAILPEVPE